MSNAKRYSNSTGDPEVRAPGLSRRNFMQVTIAGGAATATLAGASVVSAAATQNPNSKLPGSPNESEAGAQRLSLSRLRAWEDLKYGMFIHIGMSTYVVGKVYPDITDGKDPAATYNPDKLDVDQWIQIARDAGMKYAILTAKHDSGFCLWPSHLTDYTVAQSGNTTDVVEAFMKSCERRGVLPGLYYDSFDNHNNFGQVNASPQGDYPWQDKGRTTTYTTSLYQDFQTAQVTELLTQYGPIHEMWIDIPQLLGRGYRTFLYEHIAKLQPDAAIMMNSSKLETAWPTDLRSFERNMPSSSGYVKWQEVEGKRYYLPGEICDPIAKNWFYVEGEQPRSDEVLLNLLVDARQRGVNLLLDVPPDKHGLIPEGSRAALMRLRKNANL